VMSFCNASYIMPDLGGVSQLNLRFNLWERWTLAPRLNVAIAFTQPVTSSMTALPPDNLDLPPANPLEPDQVDTDALLLLLRRKQGTWITWGNACQQLQKAGYSPQQIFEASGFEPIQQNQITVAAQVYASIVNAGVSLEVRSRFEQSGSDTLYEFRILGQADRAAAAALVVEKGIDSEGAHDVAKALKDFSRLSSPPEHFPQPPGDAIAYYCWNLARQQADLQMRSRLIAQGLRFAASESARRQLEKLLTDFSVAKVQPAPRLPFYRLESDADVPRVIPVVGRLPLSPADLQAVPLIEEEGAFQIVTFSGTGGWVPVPGWQVIVAAEDPVALLSTEEQLPVEPDGPPEEILVILDRAQRQWDEFSYFVVEQDGQLAINWFNTLPEQRLLGRVLLIMRPKKVLDQDYNKELWQLEE